MASIKAQITAARARKEKAIRAIYDAALPRNDIPFWSCHKLATDAQRAAYDEAERKLSALEYQAFTAGKAYRDTFGQLTFYR